MYRITFWIALLIVGCVSSPKRELAQLKEGMDKDDVLAIAGNPKRTSRSNGQDHWIYVYFEDDREFRRQLDFRDGKITRIGEPIAKENWLNQLEDAESIEEYEQKVKAHRANVP